MNNNIKDFHSAFNQKLKGQTKEERMKAALRKLAQEMKANQQSVKEPQGLASGATDKSGKMIIDLEEDYNDEHQ